MTGYVPTALPPLSLDDAERLYDRLGLSREDWTALVARSMRSEAAIPGRGAVH